MTDARGQVRTIQNHCIGRSAATELLEVRRMLAADLPATVSDGGDWLWPNQVSTALSQGTISTDIDRDQYAFSPTVRGKYTIAVSAPEFNTKFALYNGSGQQLVAVDRNFGKGVESQDWILEQGAWYYIVVAGSGATSVSKGDYTLSVGGPAAASQTILTPVPTYVGQLSGTIPSAGQVLYYKTTVPVGATTLDARIIPQGSFDGQGKIFTWFGQFVAALNNGGAGQADSVQSVAVVGGMDYYIAVSAYNRPATGSFTVSLDYNPDNYGDPPANFSPAASPVPMLFNPFAIATASADITDVTDVNYHAFVLHDSGLVRFEVEGPVDAQVRVYDSTGSAITAVTDDAVAGDKEVLTLNLAAGSTYYVGVGGAGISTGSYKLTVTAPAITPVEIATPGISYSGTASGTLAYGGDLICYKVNAPLGTTTLALTAQPGEGVNTRIDLYDWVGRPVVSITNGAAGAADSGSHVTIGGNAYYAIVSGQTIADKGSFAFSADFAPDGIVVSVNGTSGDDVISLTKPSTYLLVDVNGHRTTYSASRVFGIKVYGGAGNDTITIGPGIMGAQIWGEAGNDSITGGDYADSIMGNDGNDTLIGGDGNDTLGGNFNDDSISGGLGDDQLQGGLDADMLFGGEGSDVLLSGDGMDQLWGDAGNDYMEGRGKADEMHGGAGNDTVYGQAGSDTIYGDDGDDSIDVGVSILFHDSVDGGEGLDTCRGDADDILNSVETVVP